MIATIEKGYLFSITKVEPLQIKEQGRQGDARKVKNIPFLHRNEVVASFLVSLTGKSALYNYRERREDAKQIRKRLNLLSKILAPPIHSIN